MRKRTVILCFVMSLVLSLTACKRHYDMTYAPSHQEDYRGQCVWVAEKYKICFLRMDLGTVGVMEVDGKERLIRVEVEPGRFCICEYLRGYFIYHEYDNSHGGYGSMEGKHIIDIYRQPKYKEGEFTVRVPLEQGQLYSGKKISFTRYEKDTVQPSDFGFDYESWDDLISQFELVNADTGETVSWDVLK